MAEHATTIRLTLSKPPMFTSRKKKAITKKLWPRISSKNALTKAKRDKETPMCGGPKLNWNIIRSRGASSIRSQPQCPQATITTLCTVHSAPVRSSYPLFLVKIPWLDNKTMRGREPPVPYLVPLPQQRARTTRNPSSRPSPLKLQVTPREVALTERLQSFLISVPLDRDLAVLRTRAVLQLLQWQTPIKTWKGSHTWLKRYSKDWRAPSTSTRVAKIWLLKVPHTPGLAHMSMASPAPNQ